MRIIRPAILLLAVMALFLFGKWYLNEREDECVTRAQAARMLAYALHGDDGQMDGESKERQLIDVEDDLWYSDEIQTVVADGLMETDGDLFHPTDCLTYNEAKIIGQQLHVEMEVPLLKGNQPIPMTRWLILYDAVIAGMKTVDVKILTVEAVPAVSEELKAWQAQTSDGLYQCEGVALDTLVGHRVRAYVSGQQLLMAVPLDEDTIDTVSTTDTANRTENDESDTVENSDQEGALTVAEAGRDVRVCLMTTGFTSEYHDKVTLMADTDWSMTIGNEIRQYQPGETVTLTADDLTEDGSEAEFSSDGQGKLQVLSIERDCGAPCYEGKLIVKRSGSQLLLINVLPLENYLYGVVPGEMPAGYAGEALKAQAVCARSYACLAMQSPKYDFADLDDSTSCQVYMNQGTDERCTEAVDETAGQVLTCSGRIVTAKYFSTSCGSLSDSRDVWLDQEETEENGHLLPKLETQPATRPELGDEAAFKAFIDSSGDGYVECDEPWFRWQVTVTLEDIKAAMEKHLKQRMAVNPKHFTVLSADGTIDTSDVTGVEILERADSGVVKKIRINGNNQTLTAAGEYNIRCLLSGSENWTVERQDGTEAGGLSLLPSGYFYMEEQTENGCVTGYVLHGGGLGHGAGMSQNGARCLAEQGYTYKDILAYYFDDTEVMTIQWPSSNRRTERPDGTNHEKILSSVSPDMDSGCSRLFSSAPRNSSYIQA